MGLRKETLDFIVIYIMSEIRFLTSSDEHISDITPGFRKDNYRNAILEKLVWQGKFAKKFNANAIIRGGDLFHVKSPNKTTMATMATVAGIHRNYHCPTFSVAGNHDMTHNDPSTINKQPLGVLFESGVISRLLDERFTSSSLSVRVIGVEYTTDLDDGGLQDLVRKRGGDTYTIAIVHALASFAPDKRIQSFFGEKIFDYRDLIFEGCPDVYVFAHYHKDQGIMDHLGVKFVNLGAISRGSLTFENTTRVPKISTISCNSQGISIEQHEIPCGDSTDVFDLEKKLQLEKERNKLEDFITSFRSKTSFSDVGDIYKCLKLLNSSNFPEDLKKVVRDTIESAESGVLDE